MTTEIIVALTGLFGLEFWRWLNTRRAARATAASEADGASTDATAKSFHLAQEVVDFYKAEVGRLQHENTALGTDLRDALRQNADLREQRMYLTGWRCEDCDCARRNPQNKRLRGLRFDPAMAGMPTAPATAPGEDSPADAL